MWYKLKKIYIWTNQVRPSWWGGWQPWANTLAYWTLDDTLNDSSWNNRNLTMSWSLSFVNDTSLCRKVLYCTWVQASNNYVYASSISWVSTITIHIWNKSLISFSNYRNLFTTSLDLNLWIRTEESSSWYMNLIIWNSNSYQIFRVTLSDADHKKWHLLSVTFDNSNWELKWYINWELNVTGTSSYYNLSNWLKKFSLWVWYWTSEGVNRYFNGYIWEVILEDKVRTAQEITNYYNQTKWDYWL